MWSRNVQPPPTHVARRQLRTLQAVAGPAPPALPYPRRTCLSERAWAHVGASAHTHVWGHTCDARVHTPPDCAHMCSGPVRAAWEPDAHTHRPGLHVVSGGQMPRRVLFHGGPGVPRASPGRGRAGGGPVCQPGSCGGPSLPSQVFCTLSVTEHSGSRSHQWACLRGGLRW